MKMKFVIIITSLLFISSCNVSRPDAIALGIVASLIVGTALFYYMNKKDKKMVQNVLENSPTGENVTWRNPDTNIPFQMAVNNTFRQGNRPCRQYTLVGKGNDRKTTTACRQANGTWN